MSVDYKNVKIGKLKLKGEKSKKRRKRKHTEVESDSPGASCSDVDASRQDTADHGGWWRTTATHQIRGDVAIQLGRLPVYITALDDGTFTVGPPHDQGDGPSPEEILTSIPTGDSRKIAFKSGYGKYIGLDSRGRLVGRAEAIGPREMWTPVYEDGETALLSSTDCFVGLDSEDNVTATSAAADSDHHKVSIRCSRVREEDKAAEVPDDEQGSLKDVELKHIRKFQKFQDKRTKVNPNSRLQLREAKDKGNMHEVMLDRRTKMKADRYCK